MIEIALIDNKFLADGRRAYDEGVAANERGEPRESCPYKAGSFCAHRWGVGWCQTNYFRMVNGSL